MLEDLWKFLDCVLTFGSTFVIEMVFTTQRLLVTQKRKRRVFVSQMKGLFKPGSCFTLTRSPLTSFPLESEFFEPSRSTLFCHLALGTLPDRPRTTSVCVITTEGMKTADLKAEPNISHFPETASGQMEPKKKKNKSILHNVIIVFLRDEGRTASRLGGEDAEMWRTSGDGRRRGPPD